MELCIRFRAPPGSNHKGLDVAFSINDLTSSDLIVCTTYDGRGQGFLYGAGSYTVRFQLRNPLANGRYLLAAAVEDRSVGQIGFYEYLEGAHYFQCYSGTGLFGMFYPMIQRAVEGGG